MPKFLIHVTMTIDKGYVVEAESWEEAEEQALIDYEDYLENIQPDITVEDVDDSLPLGED